MSDFVFILIVFLIVVGGVGFSIFYIKKQTSKIKQFQERDEVPLGMIKQDIERLREKFENGYSKMAYQLGRVQEVGRDIKEFQDFLRSPKLRGNIGEQILRDLLEQMLPKKNFRKMNLPDKDASLRESYKKDFLRDIKKHIDDISKKYILPEEGTVDFALMYIPSEPVYYEVALNQPDLLDYSHQKRVYFVSPNSFYYFLKIIMVGLEGAKIEENAKKILSGMKAIQQEALKFEQDFSLLSSHINHAKNSAEKAQNRFTRLVEKMERLGELESEGERKKLE